jgi:Ice-binding-like
MKQSKKRVFTALLGVTILASGALLISGLSSANAAAIPVLNMGSSASFGVLANSEITSATASSISGSEGSNIGIGSGTAATGVISYTGSQVLAGTSLTALVAAASALADSRGGTTTGAELGGQTLAPGAYTNGTFEITGNLTLNAAGVPSAVFILRSTSTLVTAVASTVTLAGGAQACNVFWQIGSSATLGASSTMVGHVIAQSSISTGAGSVVNGQLIAVTAAVTLGGTTIANNSCAAVTPVVPASEAPVVTTPVTPVVPATPAVVPATPAVVPATPAVVPATPAVVPATPAVVPAVVPAILHVVKVVINTHDGTSIATSFVIHVTHNGKDVTGSPMSTIGGTGNTYSLAPGNYIVYEEPTNGYRGVWSGNISTGGGVSLSAGQDLTVTRTNYDMGTSAVAPATVVTPTPDVPAPVTETVSGGQLPNTASPWGNWLLAGSFLMLVGVVGLISRKVLAK